jgi:predicted N-acyltransferase
VRLIRILKSEIFQRGFRDFMGFLCALDVRKTQDGKKKKKKVKLVSEELTSFQMKEISAHK